MKYLMTVQTHGLMLLEFVLEKKPLTIGIKTVMYLHYHLILSYIIILYYLRRIIF